MGFRAFFGLFNYPIPPTSLLDGWIIDFGATMSEADAALYEAPFEYVAEHVKPERIQNPRPVRAKYWWRHGDPQPAMRAALKGLPRYIATPEVTKHCILLGSTRVCYRTKN